MRRTLHTLSLLLLCASARAAAVHSTPVSKELFTRFPFDQWAAAGKHTDLRWNPQFENAVLSSHQRLFTGVGAILDHREVDARRGFGEVAILVRITDSAQQAYTAGAYVDLSAVPPESKSRDLWIFQQAFILPGDYVAEVALCDTETRQYSYLRKVLHVAPLRNDPLPRLWQGLPTVEMIPIADIPDAWYIPGVRQLNLQPKNERPVHVELLVNITPSERAIGSLRIFRRNMGLLIPAMKLLSGLAPQDGTLSISLADLVRHENVGAQTNVRRLRWRTLRKQFEELKPGVVDAQALARQRTMKQYFRDQVEQHADTTSGPRVLIVLSAPVVFDRQESIEPINLPPDPNRRVIYIRYRPFFPMVRGGRFDAPVMLNPAAQLSLDDDLDRILKPLNPRILNAALPMDFRKALAQVLEEIARAGEPVTVPSGTR